MKKLIGLAVGVCALLALGACTDPEGARRALTQQGYSEITLGRRSPWSGCSDGDTYKTSFRAKSIAGVWVDGVVCSSGSKGNTIRTF